MRVDHDNIKVQITNNPSTTGTIYLYKSNHHFVCQWGLGRVGKARTLRAPHLGSSLAARRSQLVGILGEGLPPHTD